MSTKTITENVITTISKGPLIVFVLFGIGFWQLSKMTDDQIHTIEKIIIVLNNPVGAVLAFFLFCMLFYAVALFPAGKFSASFLQEVVELQKSHNEQHKEHVDASKAMYHKVSDIDKKCIKMAERIDKFYGAS